MQLPQKAEFAAWVKQMVGVQARLTTGGDGTLCQGVGSPHVIQEVPPCVAILSGADLASLMLLQGVPPTNQGLIRQYFDKPGKFDGPNETQTVEKPRGSTSRAGGQRISLLNYLILLEKTWEQGFQTGTKRGFVSVPQRWIDWLKLLILHYSRYTPAQIYAFLARVDFAGPTFKV